MEEFLGLSRDSSREKAEQGSSPYNRNLVYDKKLGSITQENGFSYEAFIKGVVIGVHSTNQHIIYISIDTSNSHTIISYVNTTTHVITKVIDTGYFNYNVTRPVEIVGWYNYNQELIIIFSDGVFAESSAPRLINLMDIGVTLDNDKEFLTSRDAESTLLFSIINQPRFSVEYGGQGNHDADLVFFTMAYILPDGVTRTKFISVLAEGFPLYAFKNELHRNLLFKIEDLDPFFNQVVIGMVVYRDNALFGYTTDPLLFTGTTLEYDFTTVTSLNAVAVNDIVVDSSIYNKIKSLTIGNDTIIAGGVITNTEKSYQKYANNIRLNLYFDHRQNARESAPLLCPDEVYYFTIAVLNKNGQYSEEYHIPNRDPIPADLALINKSTYGLEDLPDNYESFKIINSGDWNLTNNSLPYDDTNLADLKLNWGFWQNEELYPNNDNYNGAIDYDDTVIVGGRDLRNTNVKLHRVPGLDNLAKRFPSRVGVNTRNADEIEYDTPSFLPAFSISVENFASAFGKAISQDGIIGYRLSFVKKDASSKLVDDITYLSYIQIDNHIDITGVGDQTVVYKQALSNLNANLDNSSQFSRYTQFGLSYIKSINQSIYKGGITSKIIKANFGYINSLPNRSQVGRDATNKYQTDYIDFSNIDTTEGIGSQFGESVEYTPTPFLIPNISQKYATVKSIKQLAGNSVKNHIPFLHEKILLKAYNSNISYPVDLPTDIEEPNPDYGWNPLSYQPDDIDDEDTPITLPTYKVGTHTYTDSDISALSLPFCTINVSFINIKKNVHQGLLPKEFVIVGASNITNATKRFRDFGDIFTSNVYNEIVEDMGPVSFGQDGVTYFQAIYSGMIAIDNNVLIDFIKDKLLGYHYFINTTATEVDILAAFDYNKQSFNKESTRQLNTLIANVAYNYNKKYINKFPFRISKSLTIQSENLSTLNVRTFLANAYYDMPATSGEITFVTGFDRGVYCQQRYSLFIFQLKEQLNNNDENSAYLAESDLFAYKPHAIVDEDNKGYIGSVHQFARKLSKDGLITIDAERGKVYIIAGDKPMEISKIKMNNFFKEELTKLLDYIVPTLFNNTATQDNPYNGNGVIIGIDDKTNRILVSIINYQPLQPLPSGITIQNGVPYKVAVPVDIKKSIYTINKCKTLSFNLDWKRWIAEHDYYPQIFVNTNKVNYAGINHYFEPASETVITRDEAHIYSTNQIRVKGGKYFYFTDETIYESYTDLLFNNRYDLSKWYKSVMWRSTVKDVNNNNIYEKTVNAIILYTDYQCSNRIELDTDTLSLIRNSEGLWQINDFRDMVIDSNALPIGEDGSYLANLVHINRTWFEKSDFISNFIVVRLIMNNIEDTQIYIHNVNVEARISDRN